MNKMLLIVLAALPVLGGCWGKKSETPVETMAVETVVIPAEDAEQALDDSGMAADSDVESALDEEK